MTMLEAPPPHDPQPSLTNGTLGEAEEVQEEVLLGEIGDPIIRGRGHRAELLHDLVDRQDTGAGAAEELEWEEAEQEDEEAEYEDEARGRFPEIGEEGEVYTGASLYYDASTMASLNPRALAPRGDVLSGHSAREKAAINRFRSYKPPPFALWDALPVRKRAAVLVLLFADRWGDLRVVVTMRAATLRNFSGHAALPGGKADNESETPYQIARREAFEEIGLPMDDSHIPRPFRIEQLCCLPPAMARTHVVVTPCVAFLHADPPSSPERSRPGGATGSDAGHSDVDPPPLVEDTMIPRLDAREVAAVFSAPFYNFLKQEDLPARPGETHPPGAWYDGTWIGWEGVRWRTHNFYVPVNNQRVSKPRRRSSAAGREIAGKVDQQEKNKVGEEKDKGKEENGELDGGRFRVWGMTGRVLLDAARIAYAEEPEMEHCEALGDGDVIKRVAARGVFDEVGEPKDAKM